MILRRLYFCIFQKVYQNKNGVNTKVSQYKQLAQKNEDTP